MISFGDYGYEIMPDGIKRGTFRSYTFFVHAADVTLRNLTIENTAGDSKTHGQAIALYAECDRFIAESCRILGHQDTLFTGPLPPEEYEPGGFRGPTESAPRINGRQYYHNCYICGDIDFIFGSATAYFEGCTIASLGPGYVTAASTPEGQNTAMFSTTAALPRRVVLSTRPISAVPGGITHGLSSWTAR